MSCSGEIVDNDDDNLIQIRPSIVAQLKKAKYGVADHSTVELCHWTKKSFKHEGSCYKHKFYGISTHQCMEFSPAGMYCENRCVYCWRPMEFYDSMKMEPEKVAEPEQIMTKLMADKYGIEQRRLGGEEIIERLIYAMINEGVYVLQEKIVSNPGDIDVIMTNGYGFPRYRGGPMCYADIIGLEKVYQCICEYDKQYPDNIWSPSGLLREMIDKGESFYKN